MNPIHWIVALITCFAGFFFQMNDANNSHILTSVANGIISVSFAMVVITTFVLGRSIDFLPALRCVKTGLVYQLVRHPMYVSSIIMRTGYVLKNPSIYNFIILIILAVLYDRRARYEEGILLQDGGYAEYMRLVKYRFVPGVY